MVVQAFSLSRRLATRVNGLILAAALRIVGDSQACGVGLVAPKDAHVQCKVGSRTSHWSERVLAQPGDAVLVFLGSNDSLPVDVRPLLARLKGTRCVWVGPPLIRGRDSGVADSIRRQVQADGTCRFLDSRPLRLAQPDGVHTSEPARWLSAALRALP